MAICPSPKLLLTSIAREDIERIGLPADDEHVQQRERTQNDQHRSGHDTFGLAQTGNIDQQQRQQVTQHDIAPPEQIRIDAAVTAG